VGLVISKSSEFEPPFALFQSITYAMTAFAKCQHLNL
jgi:hypothetical protein